MRQLTLDEITTIGNGLRVAIVRYEEDARAMRTEDGNERLAAQFDRQVTETRDMLALFEDLPEAVLISDCPECAENENGNACGNPHCTDARLLALAEAPETSPSQARPLPRMRTAPNWLRWLTGRTE
jgi:hypothetical protein